MEKLIKNYSFHFRDREFLIAFLVSLGMLASAIYINFYAGMYATESASNSVTDIILSNIRTFDVDGMFVYGPVFFWVFIGVIVLRNPQKIPFTLKTIALFVIIRSIFISLTHLGPFPTQGIITAQNLLSKFATGKDLFFSGHTGLPFLMALVFWDDLYTRIICILAALFFGTIVLLGHFHYSIDVLSAFFITYTIFHLATIFFERDRQLFNSTRE